METEGSAFGRKLFEDLNVEYENAYGNDPYKKICIEKAISLLQPGSRVLDVGCGTGVPVASMLADAGMDVHGFDISPKMVEYAEQRVPKGSFEISDMLNYQAKGYFAGIFIIYSQLSLDYASFHSAAYSLAKALQSGGIIVIGQSPTDGWVPDNDPAFDETKSYVEGYNLPFMGKPFPTLMFSLKGQREFLTSMGLEIVSEAVDDFQPENEECDLETQQYLIARRTNEAPLKAPMPLPKAR